jgi:hypothetical protein
MKKQSFSDKLEQKLRASGVGVVKQDSFGDKSARWISVNVNGFHLTINFDQKGQEIEGFSLHKDVVQVVDQKLIWKSEKKRR